MIPSWADGAGPGLGGKTITPLEFFRHMALIRRQAPCRFIPNINQSFLPKRITVTQGWLSLKISLLLSKRLRLKGTKSFCFWMGTWIWETVLFLALLIPYKWLRWYFAGMGMVALQPSAATIQILQLMGYGPLLELESSNADTCPMITFFQGRITTAYGWI